MGTNYYLRKSICDKCDRYDELHVGKSSAGWHFSLHIIPELGINDLESWKKHFVGNKIFDEYGDEITPEQMICVITERSWNREDVPDAKFLRENSAEIGLNGLLAHGYSPYRRAVRTDGTYDLIGGDFS